MNCPFGEGAIAVPLRNIQAAHPDTIIGSYPKYENGKFSTELVISARDEEKLLAAESAVKEMVANIASRIRPIEMLSIYASCRKYKSNCCAEGV